MKTVTLDEAETRTGRTSYQYFNVLYVDHDISNIRLFRSGFKSYYNVFTAESGSQALEVLRSEDIHLIVANQEMPQMTGLELLERARGEFPEVVRIILGRHADTEAMVKAINTCGIFRYIARPCCDQAELKLALDEALETCRVKRQKEELVVRLARINKRLAQKVDERTRDLRMLNEQLIEAHSRLVSSQVYARAVQQDFLPKDEELRCNFRDAFSIYCPKDQAGGDYYWLSEDATGQSIILALVDCRRHGASGALLGQIIQTNLSFIVKEKGITDAQLILEEFDAAIRKTFENFENKEAVIGAMGVAVVAVDKQRNLLTFCGGRQDLIFLKNSQLHRVAGIEKSVGDLESTAKFATHTIQMEGVTAFYLVTDGLQDQVNPEGERFGTSALEKLIHAVHHLGADEQKSRLLEAVGQWKGEADQVDDITMIGVLV